MRKRVRTLGFSILIAVIAAACASDSEPDDSATLAPETTSTPTSTPSSTSTTAATDLTPEPTNDDVSDAEISVVDGGGNPVTLDQPASRIACRNSGCSVTLAELGIVPVASTFEPARAEFYWGEAAADITLMAEGAENYAAMEPDLIVVGATDPIISDLRVIAPVYVIAELGTLADDAVKLTQDLATLTGTDERGAEMVEQWEKFAADLRANPIAGAADVELLQLWGGNPAGFSGWTSNSQWCDLLVDFALVGSCLFDPATPGTDFAEFSTEAVLAAQPTHISVQLEWQYIGESVPLENRADEAWLQLDAVSDGNAYRVPTSGNFTPSFYELIYELENYLFHVFGPDAGFTDPGFFIDWPGPGA